MNWKTAENKMKELEDRINTLENTTKNSWGSTTAYLSRKLDQREEEQQIHRQKRSRDILSRTYGFISKDRGKKWSKLIEQGRNAWT